MDETPHLHFPKMEKNCSSKPVSCFLKSLPHLQYLGQFDHDFKVVEKYFTAYYNLSCNTENVNNARQILLASGGQSIKNIPPTAAALKQYICGAAFQASLWNKCLDKEQKLVLPVGWGYVPLRSELTEASDTCKELIKCNCKKSCRGHCKCGKKGWHAPSFVLLLGNL